MTPESTSNTALNQRLDAVAWGLFLIMIGGLWLVPASQVPSGIWLIGVGLILLGLNGARYLYRIPTSTFTIILGIIALLLGLAAFFGTSLPLLPLLLILLGAKVIFDVLRQEPTPSSH